ncbi:hypothetical protein EMCRGX_G020466 [Ephydatia muelleri]
MSAVAHRGLEEGQSSMETMTWTVSARTIQCRCKLMVWGVVSQEEPPALLCKGLDYLAPAERHTLVQEAGVVSTVGAGEALAIKAGLGLPWTKLQLIRR